MANNSLEHKEILDFYDAGVEKARLHTGIGKIEFERTKEEIEVAGFKHEKTISVEGTVWIVPGFEEKWADDSSRKRLLEISKMVENHENIMGMSHHS